MAEEDDSQKTEDPTDRKLSNAREKGQVGSSQEVKSAMIILGGALSLAVLAPWMARNVKDVITVFIAQPDAFSVNLFDLRTLMTNVLERLGWIVAPVFGGLFVLAIFASVAQTGLLIAPSKLAPELSKISLLKGATRMFSTRSLVEFVKGVIKLIIVSLVAFGLTIPLMQDVRLMADYDMVAILDRIHKISVMLAVGTLGVMVAISVLDFFYQKFEFTKSMKMSKQEVKDEHKQSEGDPQIKARIRRIRAERANQRMMSAVPEADVVVTNPTHYAVAMSYSMESMSAPRVVAKGVDTLAFRIRDVAKANDVPVVENPPLARALYAAVELDEEIPAEHYNAVAEVIGYVMRLKGKIPSA
ncbi:flagellar biosynthesis protein FlhB [Varunaivibrio sulfuroxidans]|uniref:Flagellar biosynthetic protein FlhB n=1 Tax=Varunaivibrio sulfuroxidans TaxID=1773489 RepID=A0A4R3JAM3_9PROT|nr:flagellar biosynthesis protein FlhB [Varunaivibrio sulfuroxidans]TCS63039.1 flagellar biosynthetic protein FlhB [Varunaivibrio sulfuroxidans]WES31886.1 flagellar biosynthesis protein FlhB [Varunaivibrio sulfuroxidans]